RWQANHIVRLTFSGDGRVLGAATSEGTIYQMGATARHVPEGLQVGAPLGGPLAWAPDGKTLAVGGGDRVVRLLDARTARVRTVLAVPGESPYLMAFAPDGRTLGTVSPGETFVRLWDVKTGRQQ